MERGPAHVDPIKPMPQRVPLRRLAVDGMGIDGQADAIATVGRFERSRALHSLCARRLSKARTFARRSLAPEHFANIAAPHDSSLPLPRDPNREALGRESPSLKAMAVKHHKVIYTAEVRSPSMALLGCRDRR